MTKISDSELAIISTVVHGCTDLPVYIFGSRVTGTALPHSDLDICIKSNAAVDVRILGQLKEKFENCDLPYIVDISDYHRMPRIYQIAVEKEGIKI